MDNTAIRRIQKDIKELQKHPNPLVYAAPLENNLFEWHFTVCGPPDSEYEGGLYHGRILLPTNWPFSPPKIIFMNESGRFEQDKAICLSLSNYHPEEWNPQWGINTILEAIISFFPDDSPGAIGAVNASKDVRKELAIKSVDYCCPVCGPIKSLIRPSTKQEIEDFYKNENKPTDIVISKITNVQTPPAVEKKEEDVPTEEPVPECSTSPEDQNPAPQNENENSTSDSDSDSEMPQFTMKLIDTHTREVIQTNEPSQQEPAKEESPVEKELPPSQPSPLLYESIHNSFTSTPSPIQLRRRPKKASTVNKSIIETICQSHPQQLLSFQEFKRLFSEQVQMHSHEEDAVPTVEEPPLAPPSPVVEPPPQENTTTEPVVPGQQQFRFDLNGNLIPPSNPVQNSTNEKEQQQNQEANEIEQLNKLIQYLNTKRTAHHGLYAIYHYDQAEQPKQQGNRVVKRKRMTLLLSVLLAVYFVLFLFAFKGWFK